MDSQTIKAARKHAIENLSATPPDGCTLEVGDRVRWTNENGVKWEHEILGFEYKGIMATGYNHHVCLVSESYWFPHNHKTLEKVS